MPKTRTKPPRSRESTTRKCLAQPIISPRSRPKTATRPTGDPTSIRWDARCITSSSALRHLQRARWLSASERTCKNRPQIRWTSGPTCPRKLLNSIFGCWQKIPTPGLRRRRKWPMRLPHGWESRLVHISGLCRRDEHRCDAIRLTPKLLVPPRSDFVPGRCSAVAPGAAPAPAVSSAVVFEVALVQASWTPRTTTPV